MECRENCGACCIYPSISSPIPGMSGGKPAGVRCIHLDRQLRCKIFDHPDRPEVCRNFKADPLICGGNATEAAEIMTSLEVNH